MLSQYWHRALAFQICQASAEVWPNNMLEIEKPEFGPAVAHYSAGRNFPVFDSICLLSVPRGYILSLADVTFHTLKVKSVAYTVSHYLLFVTKLMFQKCPWKVFLTRNYGIVIDF